MKARTIALLILAGFAGLYWLNLAAYGVLDSQIDRMAAARMASAVTMNVGKLQYRCFIESRIK